MSDKPFPDIHLDAVMPDGVTPPATRYGVVLRRGLVVTLIFAIERQSRDGSQLAGVFLDRPGGIEPKNLPNYGREVIAASEVVACIDSYSRARAFAVEMRELFHAGDAGVKAAKRALVVAQETHRAVWEQLVSANAKLLEATSALAARPIKIIDQTNAYDWDPAHDL